MWAPRAGPWARSRCPKGWPSWPKTSWAGAPIARYSEPDDLSALCDRLWEERRAPESEATAWFRSSAGTAIPVNYLIGRNMMRTALDRLRLDPFQAAIRDAEDLLAAARG